MHRVVGSRASLGPPNDADLDWILRTLRRPEVARALGWSEGVGAEIYSGHIEGTALLLPFWNASGDRVGFILLMRSEPTARVWTVNIVVPEVHRRNGFTALAALDALCHLVFDVRGDERLVWLIEPSNGASKVLPRRLGYPKVDEVVRDGTTYERYGIGPEQWRIRRDRLARTGRDETYAVEDVPLSEVAHGRIIAAVRGQKPAAPMSGAGE